MKTRNLPILLVDDEVNMRRIMEAMLQREGFETVSAEDGGKALDFLQSTRVQAVITDLKMPGIDGMTLLRECNMHYPDIPVIMVTAHGTIETAVEAMKIGAFDYITKPFDISEIRAALQKATAQFARNRISFHTPGIPDGTPEPGLDTSSNATHGIVSASPQMRAVLDLVDRIADSPSTVLITGESGTGKELVAGLIHNKSKRNRFPFIKVNCAAIPETLMESEFFGHERGAFTGAVTAKPGRFELADKGTLLLDEISEISSEIQVKLLRAIQEREFERVGGIRTIQVDVRLIAASNLDLQTEVGRGTFRQDLFYRLNVIPLHLPPLRDRPEDISHLTRFFIRQMNDRLKKNVQSISAETLKQLMEYPWYGNIRELENVIERAVLLCNKPELTPDDFSLNGHLPDSNNLAGDVTGAPDDSLNLKTILQKQTEPLEKEILLKALNRTHGNVSQAAKIVGLSRKGFQLKLRKHSIDPRK
jgi:two-component system, NtrC family, response regulator AtoC